MIDTFKRVGGGYYGQCLRSVYRTVEAIATDDPTRKIPLSLRSTVTLPNVPTVIPIRLLLSLHPELTMALTIAGDLCFNPLTDTLVNEKVKQ